MVSGLFQDSVSEALFEFLHDKFTVIYVLQGSLFRGENFNARNQHKDVVR